MYDNSRVPLYTNISSRPCRVQYSRWSLNTPTTGINLTQTLPPATATLSSSFYLPQSQRHKQKITPNYVNLQPLPSAPSSSLSSGYERPKSTIFPSYTSVDPSPVYVNHYPQRHDSKTVVGIVKPMVHQRSYVQLNHNNNNNNNHIENKFPELMIDSYHHKSTRSLYPPPTPPTPPLPPPPPPLSSSSSSVSSSVIYRSRPTPSHNNINDQAPQIPRRHSSINNTKYLSSHRSSRSTSTSSSTAALNELSSTISSYENESRQQQHQQLEVKEKPVNRPRIDVKRLEMFYGSVGTLVKSARSVVHLYTTTTRQLANFEDWSCQQFGVPIWIYNTGANLKRARHVRLLLAHHESCFAVWSNLISDQAEIRIPKDNHITCWLPDCYLLIVLKFDDDDACRLFFRNYYEIFEHQRRKQPMNSPLLHAEKAIEHSSQQKSTNSHSRKEIPRRYSRLRTISTKHDKEQQEQEQFQLRRCRSLSKIRTVKKSDISGPINFEHVNHISSGCQRERPMLGTATLRSLHASMSHLPSNGLLIDRCTKSNKTHISALFQPHTTTV